METSTGQPAVLISPEMAGFLESVRTDETLSSEEIDRVANKTGPGQLTGEGTQAVSAETLLSSEQSPPSGYHQATRDHPFLDMSQGMDARIADAKIMAGFVEADEYPSIVLEPESDFEILLEDATHLGIDELRHSMTCQLSLILSGTFGARRHQAAYHDPESGYRQVELLKKSIPSGGSRHPSDCFVYIHRSPSLKSGAYYFNGRRHSLVSIQNDTIRTLHQDHIADSSADWVIGVVIGSIVRRAMFRYRDPRSFRAILVDAGHADGQIAALASYCNWRYRSKSDVNFSILEDTSGLGPAEAPVLISGILEGWE
ncbi:hypothetical protein ACFRJ8_19935 [Arthrobacter sp. NPDC056886]|uniref:hypothetical protein n=1 Tax=Arthrobacter sp. NPDC056886 TaxID=3345960 RepID=UPI003672A7D2